MSVCRCGVGALKDDGTPIFHRCSMTALHIAAFNGNATKLRKLLLAGVDVDEKDAAMGFTALHFSCCLGGNPSVTAILIDFGADIRSVGNDGYTPLHVAAEDCRPEMVKVLLKNGAANIINTKDLLGKTPLHLTKSHGVARLLLDAGADLASLDNEGWSSLHRASHRGSADVVRLLLDRGAAVETYNEEGISSLYSASFMGHLDVVRILLNSGAVVNKACDQQMYPLYVASQEGFVEVVKELIAAGADVDHPNCSGQTALHVASELGRLEVVLRLLSLGADVLSCDENGVAALYRAAERGQIAVVRALIAAGAQIDASDNRGQTAMHVGSERGHVDVVLELISAGAAVRKRDAGGMSALYMASITHSDVVEALLKAGADVNQASDEGETPLMRAQDLACVRLLLHAGALPNVSDANGDNALHYAAFNGSSATVICTLIKAGCDPRALNDDNETPADVARNAGNESTAELLERLAGEALSKASKSSSVADSDSKAAEGRDLQQEPKAGVPASVDEAGSVRIRRKVKPCAHCGAITLRQCAGCRVTRYCSLDCQRVTYAEHKEECAVLCIKKVEAMAQKAAAKSK